MSLNRSTMDPAGVLPLSRASSSASPGRLERPFLLIRKVRASVEPSVPASDPLRRYTGGGCGAKDLCAPLGPRGQSHARIQEMPGPDVSRSPSGVYSARSRTEAVLSSGHESLRTPQCAKAGRRGPLGDRRTPRPDGVLLGLDTLPDPHGHRAPTHAAGCTVWRFVRLRYTVIQSNLDLS